MVFTFTKTFVLLPISNICSVYFISKCFRLNISIQSLLNTAIKADKLKYLRSIDSLRKLIELLNIVKQGDLSKFEKDRLNYLSVS